MSSDCNPAKIDSGTTFPCKEMKAEERIKFVMKCPDDFEKAITPFYTIAGLPWRLTAKTENHKDWRGAVKFLDVYVHCNPDSESSLWSCEATVEIRLLNQHNPSTPRTLKAESMKFNHIKNYVKFLKFIHGTSITNAEKGYIKNGSVTLEAVISVQETKGIRLSPSFDFTDSEQTWSDGVLVVDNVRLHISKAYLALYSPVFSAMFSGEFKEKNSDEIALKDIDPDEFEEMLHVIYPSHKAVSAKNVEFLLKLGDIYDVRYVMKKCEKFLIKTDEFSLIEKLVLADQYGLTELQDVCVRTFKNAKDIKDEMKSAEEYANLGGATCKALLEKIFKLI